MTKPAKARRAYDRLDPEAATPEQPAKASAEASSVAEAIRAARPPAPEPETKLYGRRAAGYRQLNVSVPPELHKRAKRWCDDRDVTLSELVEHLLRQHIEREG
jgi:predicted HicB family RNase H-like nuclease